MPPTPSPALDGLRARLRLLQPPARHGRLRFGDTRVDACLGGGLALGALHDIAAAGVEAETGAIAAGFLACLLARLPDRRPIFWIAQRDDLYPPGLCAYGLDPGRLVLARAADDTAVLAAMEAALRDGTAAAVVAEAGRVGRIAARRLQLACLGRGSTGFLLRRWPHGRGQQTAEPLAAMTRWRLAPAPSAAAHDAPGPPRWQVTLLHARGGTEGAWIMQAGGRDAAHPVHVVAELADLAAAPVGRRHAG